MRVICESSIEEEKEQTADASDIVQQKSPVRESLRPVRTAKSNANKNLVRKSFKHLIKRLFLTILNYRKKHQPMRKCEMIIMWLFM